SVRSKKRSRDQVNSSPVGVEPLHKKQRQQENIRTDLHVIQLLTTCPVCQGNLIRPFTLPCGYTVCQNCIPNNINTTLVLECVSPYCDRIHTTTIQPNVIIQSMQSIINNGKLGSLSPDILRQSFNASTECPICCTRLTNPTTTPCGHTFCQNCLIRSLDHQRLCPFCRDSLESCPSTTQVLNDILLELYSEDEEAKEEGLGSLGGEHRVPLLIGSMAFPHVQCAIHIFEPRYRLMLRRIMASDRRRFAMCLARRQRSSESVLPFYEYGTMLELTHVQTLPDGRSMVEAVGSHRFKVIRFDLVDGYHMADIERIDDIDREQENLWEQQQILKITAQRARQQAQQQLKQSPSLSARPVSVSIHRPVATTGSTQSVHRSIPRPHQSSWGQRQSWAQQAHPQTQVNRAPWLQMHIQGLSATRHKPSHPITPTLPPQRQVPSTSQRHTSFSLPEKVIKNRQIQSTEEILHELAIFVEKLIEHGTKNSSNHMLRWLSTLTNPPILRGPQRDRVIFSWWIINIIPLSDDEKYPLLAMRTVRERVLIIISWIDRFEDQWSLFLNNSSTTSCCIS
ncbi:uncharacterized protein BX663DRAFT_425659, partial [Cokeromyces recurvatus]|uniref:uncharacterized protein n=1 Tax=Cokeromyces recurvatus TaxID=90255 RepID=UPI00221FAF24